MRSGIVVIEFEMSIYHAKIVRNNGNEILKFSKSEAY